MKKSEIIGDRIGVTSVPDQVHLESDHVVETVDLNELFGRVSTQVGEKYSASKGVLVIRQQSTGRLAAISTWKHGQVRDGLTITLPSESSLFEKVMAAGKTHVEKLNGNFSGNFFERKLLTAGAGSSIILKPLFCSNHPVGLVGYCSEKPDGFSGIVMQSFDKIVAVLSPLLERKQAES